MTNIRYVCLSDLHFGAQNSLLSALEPGSVHVDPDHVSPVLKALTDALRTLVDANEPGAAKPTLILNGDVLDLALASDDVALRVFKVFLDEVFPSGGDPLFDRTVWYLPGNHDHHMWETARERQYTSFLLRHPERQIPLPWHSTWLYSEGEPPTHAELLETIGQRAGEDVDFVVHYPNLGLRADDDSTAVLFHHGHYIEAIYRLMTTLRDIMFTDHREHPLHVWDLEAENFAWVDFLWGTLGRSGRVGEDMGLLYDMLQSPKDMRLLARNMARGLADRMPRRGRLPLTRTLAQPVLWVLLQLAVGAVAPFERQAPVPGKGRLTAGAEKGLTSYISGPVLRQLQADHPSRHGPRPDQLKFVFGHTHKPFVGSRPVSGFDRPVRLFNTGGWVIDTVQADPKRGANLILIDEDLEVASVRMFDHVADPASYRVRMDSELPEEQGSLYQRVEGLIEGENEPWRSFSAAVAAAASERREVLARILADPNAADVLPSRWREHQQTQ